jgi:hypothetical protein
VAVEQGCCAGEDGGAGDDKPRTQASKGYVVPRWGQGFKSVQEDIQFTAEPLNDTCIKRPC